MGKISNAAAQFVRNVLSRERQKSELSISSKELALAASQGQPGSQFDLGSLGGIGEALGLDRRLMHRYSDYEQMDDYCEISAGLDIYADDSTQVDSSTGHAVWITSQDSKIKEELEDMFWKRVQIEERIQPIARTLCKYGNNMEEIVVSDQGVVDLRYMSPATTRRIENSKRDLLGFVQSYSGELDISPKEFEKIRVKSGAEINTDKNVAVYEDWRVAHMRLLSKHRDSLYGWAVTEPARWVWKRLMLLEDAVMIYKLTRSPSRFAFYIDVGNLPRHEAEREIQSAMQKLKKKKFVNPKTGKLDLRFSPLSMDEDYFFASRDGKDSGRVDMLTGPSYQQVEDVEYFLSKLYTALKIPKAYLGRDENMPSKATLSQEDVRFGRSILRIQQEIRGGLDKIARVDLAARNIDPASVEFEVMMTIPSSIFELGQMEVKRARADLASMMERHVSMQWLLSNVYGLDDDEIGDIAKEKKAELGSTQGGMESISRHSPSGLLTGHAKGISDRELTDGKREDEKCIEEAVKKAIQDPSSPIGRQIKETGMLVREIAHASKRR